VFVLLLVFYKKLFEVSKLVAKPFSCAGCLRRCLLRFAVIFLLMIDLVTEILLRLLTD
jgi:hypothetical protein